MRRFGIHLNSLRAFECAARLSSFSLAAKELHVSHSTISHHVKGLEAMLGVRLFIRQNRAVSLTPEGNTLYPVLKTSFDSISNTLDDIRSKKDKPKLRITLTPSFANKWLIPRLHRFREAHPNIQVEIKQSLSSDDFDRNQFDVGVRFGIGDWPGLQTELLLPIRMTPLCSPQLLTSEQVLENPTDLRQFTLIHADLDGESDVEHEWNTWLHALGETSFESERDLSVQDPGLALNAARDGLGVAMGYLELASDDLAKGQLIQPFAAEVQNPRPYFIVIPEKKVGDIQVEIFCDWLRSETRLLGYSHAVQAKY